MIPEPKAVPASMPPGDARARSLPQALAASLLIAAALICLFCVYLRLSDTVPPNSDDASPVLAAYAVVHGNPLLHGWNLATVNYYTTDLLWYDLTVPVFGLNPRLMHIVPALIFTGIVALGVGLAWRRRPERPWLAAGVTFALLGLPPLGLTQFVLMGPLHMGAVFWMLIAVTLLDGPLTPRRLLLLAAVLTVSLFGDAITLWSLVLPLLAVCGVGWLRSRGGERRNEARVLAAALAAVVVAKVGLMAVRHLHGFDTSGVGQGFAAFDCLGYNLSLLTQGLFSLYGAYYFGRIINLGTLLILLHIAGFVVVALAVRAVLTRAGDAPASEPAARAAQRVDQTLAAAILLAVLAYFISSNATGLDTVRFLAPAYIFGAILAGRMAGRILPKTFFSHAALAAVGFLYLITFAWNFHTASVRGEQGAYNGLPCPYGPPNMLRAWLASQNLTSGYGPYWSANIVTLESRGAVQVRGVKRGAAGGVVIYHWWSDDIHWYYHVPANFVVVDQRGDGGYTVADAVRTFGQPSSITPVGYYLVLRYTHDISGGIG